MANKRAFKVERLASWLIVLAIVVVCMLYFSSFLQPFVLAIVFWYCIYVVKQLIGRARFKGRRLPEWALTVVAFIVITLVVVGIVELVMMNLELIISKMPQYVANFKNLVSGLRNIEGFNLIQDRVFDRVLDFDFSPLFTGLLNSLSTLAGNIFMIIVYVAFLLAEEKLFHKKLKILLRNNAERLASMQTIIQQIDQSVQTYVNIKTLVSLLTGFLSYIILLAFDVDFPVLWAFLIFLLNFIPYVGSFVATLFPAAFAMFQYQSFWYLIWVFAAIQVVQIIVGNVIEPKWMGRTLNLSPLGVLLALAFWGMVWGILGMILSVPITSIMVIIASRIPATRFVAVWLSETGELIEKSTPHLRKPIV